MTSNILLPSHESATSCYFTFSLPGYSILKRLNAYISEGDSMGSESSDSERLDDRRLSWDMSLMFGGVGSSEARKNWMRSRLSAERRKKEDDILMGAKEIVYCRFWLTLTGLQERGQTRLHEALSMSMSGRILGRLLLLETAVVQVETHNEQLENLQEAYHQVFGSLSSLATLAGRSQNLRDSPCKQEVPEAYCSRPDLNQHLFYYPDAAKYLQGVITANLFPGYAGPIPTSEHLRSDAGFYAAFLTAQGRTLHDVFIYRDARDTAHPPGHSWLVEVDAAEADRLQKHICRHKLRAKFDVRLLDEGEGTVWQAVIWGPPHSPGIKLPPPPLHARHPRGQSELLFNQALPHESNTDAMHAIDFRKGCYVGQELTIRTEHRGVVRKRILPCVLYPDNGQQPPPGNLDLVAGYRPEIEDGVTAEQIPREASIGRAPGGKKGRSAGKWLSGVGNVGLALCRLEIMTDVVLPGEASSGAGGFGDGDEFVVGVGAGEGEEGRKARIKAFVPEWLRRGLVRGEGH
ncbi:hypothetical protein CHGG_10497 [Chaetomium globosum CBS 148.51]|uniref:Iron-sulfur cluster assembly factor IBA57 homolog, mitochondrial n=1 Tax=Chaetomium globosum (strain ATCC 6205 / CBS 148.51 / DSM 1962 / NBRC 6347 / NRRL 1970) TaxID=306901 RepID=Q2GNF7_CHAGB|nr:uncharacterized protein CHGG_10497 [Chaetomium globosum CBS 148.51]EAQ84093.1 hypothetical protein CHGG_10497 [Chaetomium globosum CBS 148.51]